ncbi:MAG TPA: acyl--CoA ligase [Dehalococcoidia bacterium]|nr:acyl--CoA ligase [Dehalococcoidia bacterium]
MANNVFDLLSAGDPNAPAIIEPAGTTLTYAQLRQQVSHLAGQLNALGIGRNDRVALVLPNGPEAAIAFLAVAACSTAAPLNPAYREDEFRFYMDDLRAKALITLPDDAAPAHAAAANDVLRLALAGVPGTYELLAGGVAPKPVDPTYAQPDDVALVLHTSGTTARPKIVPLLQRNLVVSAGNIMDALALTPDDRCLNVMPLFHIHGLMAALLASLGAGASVVTSPGFDAFRFFGWLEETTPTWYTAVPTMHQLVLSRASRQKETVARAKLRFIRSSSASLPPTVMADLEKTFGAPVIEAYGMTEASHQMATNPLPPRERKPGAVGIGAGVQVAIMDDAGNLLDATRTGEVVIKGGNVTSGYENNPTANESSFTHGWFRTGDQGYQDEDGYLYLTGRLKEIINRGGEKVSPREVDEVLLQHPAVAQAVAFGMPHERLGEEVAAAVVLAEGATAGEKELREFAAKQLADFKVPKTIIILADIPKGATGKVQRIGLAEKLGLTGAKAK